MEGVMVDVSSAEVQRNFGAYRERAEGANGPPEPVTVMHYNKPSVVIIAAEEYARLKRKDAVMVMTEAMPSFGLSDAGPADTAKPRLGFMIGEIAVPDDFDRMGAEEIAQLFGSDA
jgi:PHD/YefM family antitoxin component YafN of YafNO toxin-antitoxin module